jgi:hypothetical protein
LSGILGLGGVVRIRRRFEVRCRCRGSGVGGGEMQGVDLGFEGSDSTLMVGDDRTIARYDRRGGRRRGEGDRFRRGSILEVGDALLDLGEATAEQ